MTYNFNDPSILRGYLEQAAPRFNLLEDPSRIVVGDTGGMGYTLFAGGDWQRFPTDIRIWTFYDSAAVRNFLGAIDKYVEFAEKHAAEYGFRILAVDRHEKKLTHPEKPELPIYSTAIGSTNIESVETLERFLKMVEEGKQPLSRLYLQLQELAPERSPR